MENGNRVITITENELMEIMADESSEVMNILDKNSENAQLGATMLMFMATFSAGILRRLIKKSEEEFETYYNYSERNED